MKNLFAVMTERQITTSFNSYLPLTCLRNLRYAAVTLLLVIGVGNVWGAVGDVTTLIDFTQTGNWGHSDYTNTWSLTANHNSSGNIACEAAYAVSNNESILRLGGGKNAKITHQLSYIGTKSATSVPVSTFKVNVTTVTSSTNLTINSVKLYVYSNSTYTTQIDCVDKTSSYNSTGEISFTPTSGSAWVSGVYFKLVWDLSTTATGSNVYTAINKLQIVEGATKTLSSIAITTQPTKRKYVQGETFSATGAVVTATYDDSSNADVSTSTTWTPSGGLSVGTQTITATCNTKTATTTVDVYAVTMQAKDEDGNAIAVGGPGAPSRTGANISPAADAGNYKFMEWTISGASLSSSATTKSNTITSPTGAVTVTAKYYKPCTVTWMVNNTTYSAGGSTSVSYGSRVSTLPTDPDPGVYCGDKFMGWTTDAVYVHGTSPLFTTAGSAPTASDAQTFYAVFADYAE